MKRLFWCVCLSTRWYPAALRHVICNTTFGLRCFPLRYVGLRVGCLRTHVLSLFLVWRHCIALRIHVYTFPSYLHARTYTLSRRCWLVGRACRYDVTRYPSTQWSSVSLVTRALAFALWWYHGGTASLCGVLRIAPSAIYAVYYISPPLLYMLCITYRPLCYICCVASLFCCQCTPKFSENCSLPSPFQSCTPTAPYTLNIHLRCFLCFLLCVLIRFLCMQVTARSSSNPRASVCCR